MAWILDLAAVLLFVLLVVIGYKRGFFKAIMRLVSGAVAALLAFWLAGPVAAAAFDLFLESRLQEGLEEQLTAMTGTVDQSLAAGIDRFLEGLPDSLRHSLEEQGVRSGQEMVEKLSLTESLSVAEAAQAVTQGVVRPAAVSLLRMLCFTLLFILLWLLLWLLTRLLNNVLRLPVLRQVNGVLGAVVGVLEGLLLVCVASTLIGWQARMAAPGSWLSEETVEETVIVQRLDLSERLLPDPQEADA